MPTALTGLRQPRRSIDTALTEETVPSTVMSPKTARYPGRPPSSHLPVVSRADSFKASTELPYLLSLPRQSQAPLQKLIARALSQLAAQRLDGLSHLPWHLQAHCVDQRHSPPSDKTRTSQKKMRVSTPLLRRRIDRIQDQWSLLPQLHRPRTCLSLVPRAFHFLRNRHPTRRVQCLETLCRP